MGRETKARLNDDGTAPTCWHCGRQIPDGNFAFQTMSYTEHSAVTCRSCTGELLDKARAMSTNEARSQVKAKAEKDERMLAVVNAARAWRIAYLNAPVEVCSSDVEGPDSYIDAKLNLDDALELLDGKRS